MGSTCILFCRSSNSDRQQKDHSVICAVMQVSVQQYQYTDVEANRCDYKVGRGEEDGTDKTRLCAISTLPNNLMHNS